MTFTRDELKRLALPALAALGLLGAGAATIGWAEQALQAAASTLAGARQERRENVERLARIAQEEREVKEKLDVYQQLQQLHILGEERRLEWADAIARIRARRELLDLRYRVERQNLLKSLPGRPASVDFFASTLKIELALLHEEDLLRFLSDLRASGNAYYSVKNCTMERTGIAATGTTTAARLRANCEIDLITVVDGAARK